MNTAAQVSDPITARLDALAPRLRRKASALQSGSPEHDADDLYQEMVLALLERAARSPAFADQADAYLLQYAEWTARHACEKSRTYTRIVGEDDDPAGSRPTTFDLLPAHEPSPEAACIHTEQIEALARAVSELAPRDQVIVKMIYLGHQEVDIARHLNVSKSAVSHRKRAIAQSFYAVLA
jgi:RNA polymerase sigma factor (sigma-70 family)